MQPQLRLSSHAKALAIAALLHAGLVGVLLLDLHLAERRIGERDGDRTAIDVDLINTDDLARLSSAGQASAPQPILELSEPPQTNENETPADPAKTGRGLAASARQSPQTPPADRKPPDQTALAKELYDLVPDPIPMPPPPAKTPPKDTASKDKSADKSGQDKSGADKPAARSTSRLDLSMPPLASLPSTQSTGITRPAGITRSGENDDFGRGVIRALRQTMPGPNGTVGQVTIRFLLNEKGNIQEAVIQRSALDPGLSQAILFSVKQANFPLPPARSTPADRSFLITYIYR